MAGLSSVKKYEVFRSGGYHYYTFANFTKPEVVNMKGDLTHFEVGDLVSIRFTATNTRKGCS